MKEELTLSEIKKHLKEAFLALEKLCVLFEKEKKANSSGDQLSKSSAFNNQRKHILVRYRRWLNAYEDKIASSVREEKKEKRKQDVS